MFTFDHPLGKPLEPLEGGLPLDILADSLDVIPQLKPGLDDRPVVGIIDHAQLDLAPVDQHTQALPGAHHNLNGQEPIFG